MCFLQEINNAFLRRRRRRKREWKVGVGWASERQNWADAALLWGTSRMQRDVRFSGRQTDSRPSLWNKHHSYYLCLVLSENHIWQLLGYMEICDFVYFLSCINWMHCKLLWIKAPAKCLNVNVTVNLATRTVQKIHFKLLFKMLNCLCNLV